MQTILVPKSVIDEVRAFTADLSDQLVLIAYAEDDSPVPDAETATGIFRWIAGKRYADLMRDAPQAKWLHTASAGVDHVLTSEIRAREGMIVTDSGPAFGPSIAEFVFVSILSNLHKLPEVAQNQRERNWIKVDQDELYGKTMGIVGLGPIGIAIAKRAKAFDMRTIGLRRQQAKAPSVDTILIGKKGLQTLLKESDFVVLGAALTGETDRLIGAAELSLMRPSAWLVNIARGRLVDEAALTNALVNGAICGAILDVFEVEPLPESSPLWSLPNVIVSPHHSGGGTAGLRSRQIAVFIDNLRRFVNDNPLLNAIDIDRGY